MPDLDALLCGMDGAEFPEAERDSLDQLLLADDPLELLVHHDSASPASPESCYDAQAVSDGWQSSRNDAAADASERAEPGPTGSAGPGREKTPECCSADVSSSKVQASQLALAFRVLLVVPRLLLQTSLKFNLIRCSRCRAAAVCKLQCSKTCLIPASSSCRSLQELQHLHVQARKLDTQAQRTKERNRIYAARTRQRKTQQAQQLRQRCAQLEIENVQLRSQLQILQEENAKLRASAHPITAAQPQSSGSGVSDVCALAPAHAGGAGLHAAAQDVADGSAGNTCARAAVNTARFTAAAVGAQKLPQHVSGAAAFKAAQQHAQAQPAVSAQPPRSAKAVAEGSCLNTVASARGGRSRRVKRGRGESLAVTLGDTGPKRSRGAHTMIIVTSQPFNLPAILGSEFCQAQIIQIVTSCMQRTLEQVVTQTSLCRCTRVSAVALMVDVMYRAKYVILHAGGLPMALAASVLVLCALACLFAVAGPAGSAWSSQSGTTPAARLPELEPEVAFEAPHRSLLAAVEEPGSAAAAAMPSAAEWSSAARTMQGVMPSAEFVCNRSACFALQAADASDATHAQHMRPLPWRAQPQPVQQHDTTVMSTLHTLGDRLDGSLASPVSAAPYSRNDQQHAAERPAKLRGVGQMRQAALPDRSCEGADCGDFAQLADNAMFGAGLIAPSSCRLVYDSAVSPGKQGAADAARWHPAPHVRTHTGGVTRAQGGQGANAPSQAGLNGFVMVDEDGIEHGATALQAAGGRGFAEHHHDGHDGEGNNETAGIGTEQAETPLVTVMLPLQRQQAADAGALTPLKHLYVALVTPVAQRLQAFECQLAQPIYA